MTAIRTFLEEIIFVANRQRKLLRYFSRTIHSRSKNFLFQENREAKRSRHKTAYRFDNIARWQLPCFAAVAGLPRPGVLGR
jgi:hypothetical protein